LQSTRISSLKLKINSKTPRPRYSDQRRS